LASKTPINLSNLNFIQVVDIEEKQ